MITLTFTPPQGERTELVLHMLGYAGRPGGDGFVYDGWDEGLANLGRYLEGGKAA